MHNDTVEVNGIVNFSFEPLGRVWMTVILNENRYFIPSNEMPIIYITSDP